MSDVTNMYIHNKNNGKKKPQNESEPKSSTFLL